MMNTNTINLRYCSKSGSFKPVKPVNLPAFLKNNVKNTY